MDLAAITIHNKPFNSLKQLVNIGDKFVDRPDRPAERWAFRGQAADYGTLVPSLARHVPDRDNDSVACAIEAYLLREFRPRYVALQQEESRLPQPKLVGTGYDVRCLSVMQHYEIPTRLLDWTSSFWIALYFACADEPNRVGEVWFYDRKVFDSSRAKPEFASLYDRTAAPPEEPRLLALRTFGQLLEVDFAITPRMERQQAHHTFCTRPCQDHAPLLDSMGRTNDAPGALRRILIEPACKATVIRYLEAHHGVTADTVFPDLMGLARHLRSQLMYWSSALQ